VTRPSHRSAGRHGSCGTSSRRASRYSRSVGFSLIEITVVIAILAGLAGAVTVGVQGLRRSEVKRTASRLAAAMRFCFDRALTTGRTYRIVIDLGGQKYWAETTDERFLLPVDKQRALEEEDEDRKKTDQEPTESEGAPGGDPFAALGIPSDVSGRLPRPRFEEYKTSTLGLVSLDRARVLGVWTAGAEERQTEGRAMLYYFPQGFAERAILHVGTEDGVAFSLEQHPLTGRVSISASEIEAPPREGAVDDTGEEIDG
jgi:general secretion pathway protein H